MGAKKYINNRKLGELSYTFQFDGLTTMIHVGSKVVLNQKYHQKMAIADIGDRNYDSAIFLAGGSLESPESINSVDLLAARQLIEDQFKDEVITIFDTTISLSLNNVGTKEYNKTLSVNRAKFASTYLAGKGIEIDRVKFFGLGDEKPLSNLKNALNRRAEFVFNKRR